jgi:hypothetical protein
MRRRHGLEVEDEGLLQDLVVFFVFLDVLRFVKKDDKLIGE